jgi:uncharacterized membrane protein YecN with MAPEG domain
LQQSFIDIVFILVFVEYEVNTWDKNPAEKTRSFSQAHEYTSSSTKLILLADYTLITQRTWVLHMHYIIFERLLHMKAYSGEEQNIMPGAYYKA